jgi:hypothetical protein
VIRSPNGSRWHPQKSFISRKRRLKSYLTRLAPSQYMCVLKFQTVSIPVILNNRYETHYLHILYYSSSSIQIINRIWKREKRSFMNHQRTKKNGLDRFSLKSLNPKPFAETISHVKPNYPFEGPGCETLASSPPANGKDAFKRIIFY